MSLEALTLGLDGVPVIPQDKDDWDDWISATQTRAYLLGNSLVNWLDRYGEENGFVRDTDFPDYDERLEFPPFIMNKGGEFEAAIAEHLSSFAPLTVIAQNRDEIRDLASAEKTFQALCEGKPILHQAVLRDAETRTYGAPDFLIRSDVFNDLFPGHILSEEAAVPAPDLGNSPWHYVVVDAKFTTLHLLVGGQVGNSGSGPAYKAQLYVYNRALGRLQGYIPREAFLLGRGWDQTKKRVKSRGTNAMERLGPVTMAADIQAQVDLACEWLRRLRTEGADWSPLPTPTVSELWPTLGDGGFPWEKATSKIASELNDLTQLWYVGSDKRDIARTKGITSWRDSKATAEVLGVTGDTTRPTLQAILDINQTEDGPPVSPAHVRTAEDEWRPAPVLEFYVDFETVSNVNDDFSKIPEQNGQNLISMIGCGHMQDGEWVFQCFIVERLDEVSEAEAIDKWLAHMAAVSRSLGEAEQPRIIHWSYAEPVNYEDAYDSARERHPDKGWPKVNWFDLWARVVRKEPVVVRGALNFGLKSFARALHSHGLIQTSWGDTKVDGLGAMTGAWWCGTEADRQGCTLSDIDLMQEIARYNEVDCKVMQEIITYMRSYH